ncbi:hypothetical protein B0H13DRAFT_375362 [Mycena leptocephala]|nr:hypothetical protein B0H13DRAFT_375362 [Mycena leptocephala]
MCFMFSNDSRRIGKGELRFGKHRRLSGQYYVGTPARATYVNLTHLVPGAPLGYVTEKVTSNGKNLHDEATEIYGFDDLRDEDKKGVIAAHVAKGEIPRPPGRTSLRGGGTASFSLE